MMGLAPMADRSTSALIVEIRYLLRMITKLSEVREPLRSALAPTIRPLTDELDRLSGGIGRSPRA
jgi:hypothetical protein